MNFRWVLLSMGLVLAGCASTPPVPVAQGRLENLGTHHFAVTTKSAKAQEAFDRGLILAYSFTHAAAEGEFRKAIEADPECAMAYWGVALVRGPYINHPKPSKESAAVAFEFAAKARAREAQVTPLERDLIEALSTRYADPEPNDRSSLDAAYKAEMGKLWKRYGDRSDVATLFAESAMDIHPWDYWKDGKAQPWTSEIVGALESALKLDPENPGANHLYIHMREASPAPEKALTVARRLPSLVPDAGHMQHMPGHIYVRLGMWPEALQASRNALAADDRYRRVYPNVGFDRSIAHDEHFCAYVSMMLGNEKEAVECARRLIREVPASPLEKNAEDMDPRMAVALEALMRFGRWEQILKEPEPSKRLPITHASWHFTRAVALTALNRLPEAVEERASFLADVKALPADSQAGTNPARRVFDVADSMLDGEMAAKRNDFVTAIAKLRASVAAEDALLLGEPPDWMQPVRHTLGAVLLRAGQPKEAEQVYRDDLKRNPENGWALLGLRDSLARQHKPKEAKAVAKRQKKAWREADVRPKATCFCQQES